MKIFCVGLSRTGTRSLTAALCQLGYDARHFRYTRQALRLGPDGTLGLDLAYFHDPDAFLDVPVSAFYPELDVAFPDSLFIHTVRDKESWLKSCERYGNRREDPEMESLRIKLYGAPTFDRDSFEKAYDKHVKGIESYFRSRADTLLTLDVLGGEGWAQLCPFLGKPIPKLPFPHRATRLEEGFRRLRKRVGKVLGQS